MCGIAGYIGLKSLSQDEINRCGLLMRRRGPDNFDFYRHRTAAGRKVYLLHSRLNIIDLAPRANQPFREKTQVMVFNGELYNYQEIRKKLLNVGETFRTDSDTEVLAKVFHRYGPKSLDQCEGMWAFAVYDELEDQLTLCRDRFGEKPLYLARRDHGLYFASELKFLFALIGDRPPINYSQLYRSVIYGSRFLNKGQETYFKNVHSFRPATILTLHSTGEEQEFHFWNPTYNPDLEMDFNDAVFGTRERLIRSVELRLESDVPLAFCMSGGVDSSALISIAKKECGYDVHGFTFTSADPQYDELVPVRRTVDELAIQNSLVPAESGDFLERLRELLIYHDAPLSTITWYANWLVMESIAKHGYSVSLSGVGADELFSGHYDHHLAYLYEVRGNPIHYAKSLGNWEKAVLPFVRNPYLRNPNLFRDDPNFRGHLFMESNGFHRFLTKKWQEPFREERRSHDLLRNRMLNELFEENVPVYLCEEDLNAMYFSIENRSPYLDRNLMEFANLIPTKHLIRNGLAKAVLRDSMRNIVPEHILANPVKTGFNAAITSFIDLAEPRVRSAFLSDSSIFSHFSKNKIEHLLATSAIRNNDSKFLFSFLNAKIFLDEFE